MADNLSASELRQRYHQGGSIPDDGLSASQLRARHGVARNSADWSTRVKEESGEGSGLWLLIAGLGFVAVTAIIYFGLQLGK